MSLGYPGQFRQTGHGGEYDYVPANWKGALVVDGGDLVYQDTADTNAAGAPYDKSATQFTWDTNIATTQAAFRPKFKGVSTATRKAAQTTDGTEVTDGGILATGEFTFPCAALGAAAIPGNLVSIAKATGNALDPKAVAITATAANAIGKLTKAAAVGATRLTFRLLSPLHDPAVV